MTGFGASRVVADGLTLRCEMRSVNHRHLVVRVKGPSELGGLDVEIEKRVKKRLVRGSVSCNLWLERDSASVVAKIHGDLLIRYAKQLEELADTLVAGERVSMDRLLSLPGVIGAPDETDYKDQAYGMALEVAEDALLNLESMRAEEGQAMATDLAKHRADLAVLMAAVDERMPVVVKEHFAALKRRVTELTEKAPLDADLARELALLADRHDVSEEISRLNSHVVQLDKMLAEDGAVGRKLDFLIQEVLREVNTIGSKCNDAEVAHMVVDMKNVVERLREQVQNVE